MSAPKYGCLHCMDVGWVCEVHPDRPFADDVPGGCTECGIGVPCKLCNLTTGGDDPPRFFQSDEVYATNKH